MKDKKPRVSTTSKTTNQQIQKISKLIYQIMKKTIKFRKPDSNTSNDELAEDIVTRLRALVGSNSLFTSSGLENEYIFPTYRSRYFADQLNVSIAYMEIYIKNKKAYYKLRENLFNVETFGYDLSLWLDEIIIDYKNDFQITRGEIIMGYANDILHPIRETVYIKDFLDQNKHYAFLNNSRDIKKIEVDKIQNIQQMFYYMIIAIGEEITHAKDIYSFHQINLNSKKELYGYAYVTKYETSMGAKYHIIQTTRKMLKADIDRSKDKRRKNVMYEVKIYKYMNPNGTGSFPVLSKQQLLKTNIV